MGITGKSWAGPADFTLGCFPRFAGKESQRYANLEALLGPSYWSVQDSLYILLTEDSEAKRWHKGDNVPSLLERFQDKLPLRELDSLMLAALQVSTKYSEGELSPSEFVRLGWRKYLRTKVRKENRTTAQITFS